MGTTVKVEVKPPKECPRTEIDAFEDLVKLGGEVTAHGLRARIENAFYLALAKADTGELVAVAALKKPNDTYRESVFKKSQSSEKPSGWPAELGWIFVKETYRKQGLATRLVKALFSEANTMRVYATARKCNDPILPLLQKYDFVPTGRPYSSSEGSYDLVLHLRQA